MMPSFTSKVEWNSARFQQRAKRVSDVVSECVIGEPVTLDETFFPDHGIRIKTRLYGIDYVLDIYDKKTYTVYIEHDQIFSGDFTDFLDLVRKVTEGSRAVSSPFCKYDIERRVISLVNCFNGTITFRQGWNDESDEMVFGFKITHQGTPTKFYLRVKKDKTFILQSPKTPILNHSESHYVTNPFNNSIDLIRCVFEGIVTLNDPAFTVQYDDPFAELNTTPTSHTTPTLHPLNQPAEDPDGGGAMHAELLYQSMSILHARVGALEKHRGLGGST